MVNGKRLPERCHTRWNDQVNALTGSTISGNDRQLIMEKNCNATFIIHDVNNG